MIWVTVVNAANIFRDVREMITNTLGGKMKRYEELLNVTLGEAMAKLEQKARESGYDGCVGVRISHPRIVDGACELVVYGTGFNYVRSAADNN